MTFLVFELINIKGIYFVSDVFSYNYKKFFLCYFKSNSLLFFRLANLDKERKMADMMTRFMSKDISSMQVKDKWKLDTQGECYNHLVGQLQTMTGIHSPLSKMSCAG